jgi:hypothetical protein
VNNFISYKDYLNENINEYNVPEDWTLLFFKSNPKKIERFSGSASSIFKSSDAKFIGYTGSSFCFAVLKSKKVKIINILKNWIDCKLSDDVEIRNHYDKFSPTYFQDMIDNQFPKRKPTTKNWITDAITKEMKHHFKQRAIIPKEFVIEFDTARNYHKGLLQYAKEEELDYYDDFSDKEIPLITDDVYASFYELNFDSKSARIIDSFMSVEDFNLIYIKKHLIPNKIEYAWADVYGTIMILNKY